MFDLILGVETLVKFGVILDFKRKVLTIDHHELTMRPLGAFSNIKKLYRITKGNDDLLRISDRFQGHLRKALSTKSQHTLKVKLGGASRTRNLLVQRKPSAIILLHMGIHKNQTMANPME